MPHKEDNVTECLALIKSELPYKQLLEVSFIISCWDKIIPDEDVYIIRNTELKDLRAISWITYYYTTSLQPTHWISLENKIPESPGLEN